MRFLTGMLFGTALTLLAATAVDAPTHALTERASSEIRRAWDRLLQITSDALFDAPDTEQTARAAHPGTAADPRAPDADPAPASEPVSTPTAVHASAPGAAPAQLTQVAPRNAASTEGVAVDLSAEAQANALAAAAFDLPLIQVRQKDTRMAAAPSATTATVTAAGPSAPVATASATAAPTATATAAATSAVWVPFHSERSALGFARRLTSEIQHPFEVQRQGPGAYQVVYQAASADEIAGLEARIAEVTGR